MVGKHPQTRALSVHESFRQNSRVIKYVPVEKYVKYQNIFDTHSRIGRLLISIPVAFVISLLSLLRGQKFDQDYQSYASMFSEINMRGSPFSNGNVEPGYYLIMWIFKTTGLHFDFLLFSITFFCLWAKYYSVASFGKSTLVLFIIFYSVSFFLIHELNQTRVAISSAFFYLAVYGIFNSYKINATARRLLLFSPLFHYSSLMLIPVFAKAKAKTIIFYYFFGLLAIYFWALKFDFNSLTSLMPQFMAGDERVIGYLFELLNSSGNALKIVNGGNLFYLACALFFRFSVHFFTPELKFNKLFLLNEFLIYLSFFIFYAFLNVAVVAARMSELLRIFTPLVMAIILSKMLMRGSFSLLMAWLVGGAFTLTNLVLHGPAIHPINNFLFTLGLSRSL